jgi:uncharacterized protein (UPF0335 family)
MNGDNSQAASIIARILRLQEERDAITGDIREVYAEAKANGHDKTALGAAIARIRKRDAGKLTAVEEAETIRDLYIAAYDQSASHTYAREAGK